MNICGLKSKLKYNVFENYIQQYDVICLYETKLNDFENIQIEGFELHVNNRKKYVHCSGGIGVLVKNYLSVNIDFIESNEICTWFWIRKILPYDIICAAIYIPPESSAYANDTHFEMLEDTIVNLRNNFENPICLLGDLNARTGALNEYISIDECIKNELNVEDFDDLELLGFNPERVNKDVNVNKYGRFLIEMCKSVGLYIVNGRVGHDKFIGDFTCTKNSTLDYVICSPCLFPYIIDFEVAPFNNVLSDIHCPLNIVFTGTSKNLVTIERLGSYDDNVGSIKYAPVRPKWNEDKKQNFIENIPADGIVEITACLNNMIDDKLIVVQQSMNDVTDKICNLFKFSANKCAMLKRKNGNAKEYKRKSPNKPWFDKNCEHKRKELFHVMSTLKRSKSVDDKHTLSQVSKEYKKIINKAYHEYHKELTNKIRNLRSRNLKEYWSIINDKKIDKSSQLCKISLEGFTKHFEKLNSSNEENPLDVTNIQYNNELNREFENEEIIYAINKLKTNKSCGVDEVINEFIRSTVDIMLPIYNKLFNVILETGIVPDSWCVGIIKPIYKKKGDIDSADNYRGITMISCMSKLFSAVVNNRLTAFVEDCKIIGPEQAGFRRGFSTTDHIFTLKGLIDVYLLRRCRLYGAFVDFKKAFDNVNHVELWRKLLSCDINGKIFSVVYNLYSKAKSCVSSNNMLSEFFLCRKGVRQGDNLSPLLFAVFLHDLESFMSKKYNGLKDCSRLIYESSGR